MKREASFPYVHGLQLICLCWLTSDDVDYANDTKDAEIMLTGKVIQFDEIRGYGFIAPDSGGEDVFVHANVLGDDKFIFGPGLRVEFEATDGDRGPKAYAVHLLPDRSPAPAPAPAARLPRPLPQPPGPPLVAQPPADQRPVAASAVVTSAPAPPSATVDNGEEELCDVLTASAFSQEVTELLLKSVPTVTAAQILDVRAELVIFGCKHGWVES